MTAIISFLVSVKRMMKVPATTTKEDNRDRR